MYMFPFFMSKYILYVSFSHCVFCALYVMRQMNRELHAQGLVRQVALSMGGTIQLKGVYSFIIAFTMHIIEIWHG